MVRERLLPFLEKNASNLYTLDIGCANSPYEYLFPIRCGFDSRPMKGVDVVGDALNLPFKTETFDRILCTEALHHMQDPFVAVDEMWRVLKPGGVAILSTRMAAPIITTGTRDYFRFTENGLKELFKRWEVTITEESGPLETIGILLQRIAFQTDLRGGKVTKGALLLLARVFEKLQWLVLREYQGFNGPQGSMLTSGYHIVATKV